MSRPVALVTGAGGEMGTLLVPALRDRGFDVVTVDLVALPEPLRALSVESVEASVLDHDTMDDLICRHRPSHVYHLAAVLSAKAELDPSLAHHVNVDGTFELFRICLERGSEWEQPIRFMFPSSIAVYGLPDAETKARYGAVAEWQWNVPTGMYGCNKLYGELIGTFRCKKQYDGHASPLDFRSIRFPGLISADTLPTSGTTDYAPAMIHAAVRGEPYACFVREDTALPFMTMPDAVEALLKLAEADAESLSTRIYNIKGFSATAGEIRDAVLRHYPAAEITFEPVPLKQALADTWPADVDDHKARRDWGLTPKHDLAGALADYLLPALKKRYAAVPQTASGGE
jgi:threonine 3-dehydrogenase